MKAKGFLLVFFSLSILSLIIPTSQALEYSQGVKVGDIYTWEITEAIDPYIIGLTMEIEITEIENTTNDWIIRYFLKDWNDYYLNTYRVVSKGGHKMIFLFCLLPVQDYLQDLVSNWGFGKDCSSSGNSFWLSDTEQYTYDTRTGILLLYSLTGLDGYTYKLQGQSGSILGYNLTMIIGLSGISIVLIVIIIKKKTLSLR